MSDKAPRILFGILAIVIGAAVGWLMYLHPEGLNPKWPLWMAELAPAAFVIAGMQMTATGLGFPRLGSLLITALLVCGLAIFNFAAFFTTPDQCSETLSFLGFPLLTRHPGEADCKIGAELIVGTIDLLIVLGFLLLAKQKFQRPRGEPPQS